MQTDEVDRASHSFREPTVVGELYGGTEQAVCPEVVGRRRRLRLRRALIVVDGATLRPRACVPARPAHRDGDARRLTDGVRRRRTGNAHQTIRTASGTIARNP